MNRPIVIDVITFFSMLAVTLIVSIITKGHFGGDNTAYQRIAQFCLISTVAIIIVAINKFFLKYTVPVDSPVISSLGFGIITATALIVSPSLAIGIGIAGAICLWLCVIADPEIVKKKAYIVDAVVMFAIALAVLHLVPALVINYMTP